MSNEVIETEAIPQEHTQAIAVRQNSEIGLFGTQDPSAVIGKAKVVAQALKDVIVKQGLVSKIQGKEYPRCEAWTLLGTMLGVFPVLVWTKPVEDGWEARVEARTKDGAVIGAAEAQCLRAERNWQNRDDFALRSMAQTRATAKCLRMPLGFVMSLSGFEVTPAEEMVADHPHKPEPTPKPASASPKFATKKTREWFIKELGDAREHATGFLIDLGWIMPNESLGDMPLRWVPISKSQLERFKQRMGGWIAEGRAEKPYDANPEAPLTDAPKPSPKPKAAASSDDSAEPPGGWQGATHVPEQEDRPALRGKIETVSLKEGKSKKGPWSLWGIKIEGEWVNTFSNTIGQSAKANKGQDVTLFYEMDGDRKKAVELFLLDGTSVKSE